MARGLGKIRSKRARALTLIVGVLGATSLLAVAEPAQGTAQPAKMADTFVDSIGVDTHLGYLDTVYNSEYPLIKDKLSALGVRHVRDAAFVSSSKERNELVYGRYRQLAAMGARFNLTIDPRRDGLQTVDQDKIAQVEQLAGPSLESFEGPNELDVSGIPDWASFLRSYQKRLYLSVKGNTSTQHTPVIGPALAHAYNASTVGDLSSYMNFGNMHPYPGGKHPGHYTLDEYNIRNSRSMSGSKPFMPSETGYHTTVGWNGGHPGVSEQAMGKYMPRLYLEYFNRDIPRTYGYEFIDHEPDPNQVNREAHFGLLRNDGTEKPAYNALENLIALLEDSGPKFTTSNLNYSLSGDTAGVHRTLLQKRDGTFYLVLWQEVPSYDLEIKRDISVPNQKVTLTLNQPIKEASTYLPNVSNTPVKQYVTPKQFDLDVPDHPLVVELKPADSGGGTAPSNNTAPVITDVKPSPGGQVAGSKPTITATVLDRETDLAKSNISAYIDGRRSRFAYDQFTDTVKFRPRYQLKRGAHHWVKIVAHDSQGLDTTKRWKFKVKSR